MTFRARLDESKYPVPFPDFPIASNSVALLVVDVQYYMHEDFGTGRVIRDGFPEVARYFFPRLNKVVLPNISKLLDTFRENELRVVYTAIGPLLPDGSDMTQRRRTRDSSAEKTLGSRHLFPKGSKEHRIMDKVKPLRHELVIDKNSSSPFNSTGIDQILRNMGIDTLLITGLITEACVITTARDAADRGYRTAIVEDACAAFDPVTHQAQLESFAKLFGRVVSTDEAIAELMSRPSIELLEKRR